MVRDLSSNLISIGVFAVSLLIGSSSSAGGYEFPGDGTRAIGRGGAFSARADDPMAIVVNPAALASLPGTQFLVTANLLFAKDCFDRNEPGLTPGGSPTPPAWDDGWGTNPNDENPINGGINYTEVCNDKSERFTAIPAIGVTWRISKRVGMGFGIIPPNSEQSQRWGSSSYDVPIAGTRQQRTYDGYVTAPDGSVGQGNSRVVPLDRGQNLLPAPSRFALVERDLVLVYPTFAVGAKPFRWLQIGAAFGWGIGAVNFTNNLRILLPGEGPSGLEGQAEVRAQDWFTPRVSFAIHFIPHDNFDIVGVFRWDDALRATGDITTNVPVVDDLARGPNSLTGSGTITAQQPWWMTFGVRYADRVAPRPDDPDASSRGGGDIGDPMQSERWDVEVDVVYEKNSAVSTLDVAIEDLRAAEVLTEPINTTLRIGHQWRDQLSVRAGGDWNVLPGQLALRAGFSYETNGLTGIGNRTATGGTIDFMPLQRFGLHLGFSVRIGKLERAELSGAFTYFWMTPHTNTNGGTEQVVIVPFGGDPQIPGDVVNNGLYTSRFVVASTAFRYFFKGHRGR